MRLAGWTGAIGAAIRSATVLPRQVLGDQRRSPSSCWVWSFSTRCAGSSAQCAIGLAAERVGSAPVSLQAMSAAPSQDAAQEKSEVKGYFETTGFDRWNRIYSESDDVNRCSATSASATKNGG